MLKTFQSISCYVFRSSNDFRLVDGLLFIQFFKGRMYKKNSLKYPEPEKYGLEFKKYIAKRQVHKRKENVFEEIISTHHGS